MTALRQTLALLLDAYRELAAGNIFWITMALNVLIVSVFAMIGINEDGVSFLVWDFPFLGFNSNLIPPGLLYKQLFSIFGVDIWLSRVATILGLVSTAGIIPNFVASGAIELHLSKPIGRVRLFVTKYFSGLLFTATQVFAFCLCVFLLIGIRGGDWEPRVFLAVPIVSAFFSFLYCVAALLGLLTRSTVTALLLTMLFWFAVFIVNLVDSEWLEQRVRAELVIERTIERERQAYEQAEQELARMKESGEQLPPREQWAPGINDEYEAVSPILHRLRDLRDKEEEGLKSTAAWHDRVLLLKTVLPKTQETIGLLSRSLMREEEYDRLGEAFSPVIDEIPDEPLSDGRESVPASELIESHADALRSRDIRWILGTSFAFEAAILGIGAWRFSRRDF